MPDWDPAFDEVANKTDKDDDKIGRPEDPVFKKRGYNRKDKSTVNNMTPVWGIVTEPVKGELAENSDWTEYIPSSHVKYLEQTGGKVVAISYQIDQERLEALLD